jgi:hypothetical protein
MLCKRPFLPWGLLLGVLLSSGLSLYWFSAMAYQTDSPSYVNAVLIWAGDSNIPDRLFRLSKPLSLLFPLLAYCWLGWSVPTGLFMQQYLAYCCSAVLIYNLLQYIFGRRSPEAVYGTLLYFFCQPMAVYGLAFLTDGLGWCLLLLGLWWSQRLIGSQVPRLWTTFLFGFFLGTACFVKESVVVAGLFTGWWILLQRRWSFFQQLAVCGSIALGGLLALALGNGLTYWYWGSSLVQWLQFGQDTPPPFSWRGFLAQAYHTLDAYWWLFLAGVFMTWRKRAELPVVLWAYAASLACGWLLLPLTWPYLYDRILFMLVPVMLPFLALGAAGLGRWAWPLLLAAGVSQLWVTHGIYFHQQAGWIVGQGLFFLVIFGLAYIRVGRVLHGGRRVV